MRYDLVVAPAPTDRTTFAVPHGGGEVLENVAAGRGPWAGFSKTSFAARRAAIEGCRACGLLTPENHLTDLGKGALRILRRLDA